MGHVTHCVATIPISVGSELCITRLRLALHHPHQKARPSTPNPPTRQAQGLVVAVVCRRDSCPALTDSDSPSPCPTSRPPPPDRAAHPVAHVPVSVVVVRGRLPLRPSFLLLFLRPDVALTRPPLRLRVTSSPTAARFFDPVRYLFGPGARSQDPSPGRNWKDAGLIEALCTPLERAALIPRVQISWIQHRHLHDGLERRGPTPTSPVSHCTVTHSAPSRVSTLNPIPTGDSHTALISCASLRPQPGAQAKEPWRPSPS
jgi:hypothetical protein